MHTTAVGSVALLLVVSACARKGGGGPQSGGNTGTMISFAALVATPAPEADLRASYGAGAQQFGDLRLPPDTAGRHPVVVFLHGGCWRSAYPLTHVASAAAAIANAGYVVWVPEYRRVGDAGGGWPGTFDDVAAAVDFLRVLALRVPAIDTAWVVLVGHSAGGQLALWAASRARGDMRPDLARGPKPLRVAGIVSLAGVTDMVAFGAAAGGCNSTVSALLGGNQADVPQRYRAVNPIENLPLGVPVQLVHGAADPIVPVDMSERYASRARAAGDSVGLARIEGAGHFDVISPRARAWTAVTKAIRWLAPLAVAPIR